MSLAKSFAVRLSNLYGPDPWAIAEGLGVDVHRDRLPTNYREVYFSFPEAKAGIIIASDASPVEARELLSHGLAHHLLHSGDRFGQGSCRALWSGRHEREADDFAAYLLVAEHQLISRLSEFDTPPVFDLARSMGVSECLMHRRLRLLGRDHGAAVSEFDMT